MELVVGIAGASGVIYGIRLLQLASEHSAARVHLIVTRAAEKLIASETPYGMNDIERLCAVRYHIDDIEAPVASGSFETDAMVVIPCSIKTLCAIATCYADNLLVRTADVMLKERRRLVVCPRETPLHLGHLRAMEGVTEAGGIVMPLCPPFYGQPMTLDALVTHMAARVLGLVGIDVPEQARWAGGSAVMYERGHAQGVETVRR